MCGNLMNRQSEGGSVFGVLAALAVLALGVFFVLPRAGFGGIWGLLFFMFLLKFAQNMLAWRPAERGYRSDSLYDEDEDDLLLDEDESIEGRLEKLERLRRKELISEGEFAALRERVLEEV